MAKYSPALIATLLLGACATGGDDYSAPDSSNLAGERFVLDAKIAPLPDEPAHDWWQSFNDPALEQLVGAGFAANRDLREASANVARARAALGLQRTERRPTGEVTADADYAEQAPARGRAVGSSGPDTSISLGLAARWELDLFGRLARLTEAAAADLEASRWDRRDVQAVIVADIATAYLEVRSAEAGIAITERNTEVQRETLALTEVRFDEGAAARIDVARASAQLRSTEARIAPFRADRSDALNRLATLTGLRVNEVEAITGPPRPQVLQTPDQLPLSDVSGLLQRRADIRRAEQELAAFTARAGAQRADYFPTITLLGSVSSVATEVGDLGGSDSIGFGIGPRLAWSGFDWRRTGALVAIADAETEAALARYERTVLEALEETQSAFARFSRARERLALLDVAVRDSRQAAALARLRYEEGADDFLSVLDAEARLLVTESDRLDAQRGLAQSVIDVYRGLGAGWQPS